MTLQRPILFQGFPVRDNCSPRHYSESSIKRLIKHMQPENDELEAKFKAAGIEPSKDLSIHLVIPNGHLSVIAKDEATKEEFMKKIVNVQGNVEIAGSDSVYLDNRGIDVLTRKQQEYNQEWPFSLFSSLWTSFKNSSLNPFKRSADQ